LCDGKGNSTHLTSRQTDGQTEFSLLDRGKRVVKTAHDIHTCLQAETLQMKNIHAFIQMNKTQNKVELTIQRWTRTIHKTDSLNHHDGLEL